MKRIAQLLGLTALSIAFIGCSPSNAEKKGIIAYSPLTLSNPFFKVIGDNIKAEAEKNGYETLMVDPDMDVKKQSDQMEDFISRGVTAIILVPCSSVVYLPMFSSKAGLATVRADQAEVGTSFKVRPLGFKTTRY